MSTHPSVHFNHKLFRAHAGQIFGEGEDDQETLDKFERESQPVIDKVGQMIAPLITAAKASGLIVDYLEGCMRWDGKRSLESAVLPLEYVFKIEFYRYFADSWIGSCFVRIIVNDTDEKKIKDLEKAIQDLFIVE